MVGFYDSNTSSTTSNVTAAFMNDVYSNIYSNIYGNVSNIYGNVAQTQTQTTSASGTHYLWLGDGTYTSVTIPSFVTSRAGQRWQRWFFDQAAYVQPAQVRRAQRRAALREQHTPMFTQRNHRGALARATMHSLDDAPKQELVALGLLRQMVSAEDFREYLRRGVLSVRGGVSGWVYAIPRHGHIAVYDRGSRIAELCVHLKHQAKTPPTDEVVAKMLMVELDEADLWKRSNVHACKAAQRTFDAALAQFGASGRKLVLVA